MSEFVTRTNSVKLLSTCSNERDINIICNPIAARQPTNTTNEIYSCTELQCALWLI